jgi:hypothetical protein
MSAEQKHTPKLSKAQIALLREAARGGGVTCIERYRPAHKLIEYGLATARVGSFGSQRVEATAAGRAVIAKVDKS